MSYQIILAELKHLQFVAEIENAAAEMFSLDDLPPDIRAHDIPLNILDQAITDQCLWVAINEHGKPVGFLLADIVDNNFHIRELDVHPNHGRQGLGTRLLHKSIQAADERGFILVTLTTFSHISWNAAFYQRYGFKQIEKNWQGKALLQILEKENLLGLRNRIAMYRAL